LFASYREKAGQAEVPFDLAEGVTVGHLAEAVARRYPAIARDPTKLVVAVNQEYRDHGHVLGDGDEVALIPPVSGGVFRPARSPALSHRAPTAARCPEARGD
jgi:molybdopterin converting factor subunit 1